MTASQIGYNRCNRNRFYGKYFINYSQEDDFGGLGRISYTDSYSTGRVETRLAQLVTCQET